MRGYGWGRNRQLALGSFPIYKTSYKDVEFLDQLCPDVNIHHHGVLVQTKKHSYTISEISDFIFRFSVFPLMSFSLSQDSIQNIILHLILQFLTSLHTLLFGPSPMFSELVFVSRW